jgi:hypothetical protein
MTSQCRRISIAALATVGLSAWLPAAAGAGSLLSGYGGPGQGNQAILGSALLNGPKGGGGAGAPGGAGSPAGSVSSTETSGAGAAKAGSTAGHGSARSGAHGGRSSARPGQASNPGSHAYAPTSPLSASEPAGSGSSTLGLSGSDLLYIILALGALVGTGALTRQLTHRPR